jgi:tRNA pseudouridine38-40 synthase
VNSFNAKHQASYREYSYFFPAALLPADAVDRLTSLTCKFVGSKKYHNFSRDISPTSAEAKRYIIKFDASSITFEDCSFVRLDVTGQSFLYHQIRSMVGILVHVVLGKAAEADIDLAFEDQYRPTPLAPAEGLCLSWVHFQAYNRKHPEKPVELTDALRTTSDEFFAEKIRPSIVTAEREGV